MDELARRIKELMDSSEMSRQEFANATHISLSTLSNIFNGRSKATLNHVQALLRAFPTISYRWILTGQGSMFMPESPVIADDSGDQSGSAERSLFDFPLPSPTLPSRPPVAPGAPVAESKARQICEIRVFYDDNTWETFVVKK